MATTKVTDASFQNDVLGSTKPVLVDFWAEWCGPCKIIAPALEEVAVELAEKVTIAKFNIEENPDLPGRLGIRGIPTFHLYKDGQKVIEHVGLRGIENTARLRAWLESQL